MLELTICCAIRAESDLDVEVLKPLDPLVVCPVFTRIECIARPKAAARPLLINTSRAVAL
jgi:hypothetical protein